MLPELQQVQQTDISMFQKRIRLETILFGVSELNIKFHPFFSFLVFIYLINIIIHLVLTFNAQYQSPRHFDFHKHNVTWTPKELTPVRRQY